MTDEVEPQTATDETDQEANNQEEHRALKVPRDAFEEFLERMKPGRRCGFCESGTYEVAPSPAGGTAGVVATPVPNMAKIGVWFFVATCDQCGDTRFFHSGQALTAMTSDE